jgi:hypothetical protein
MRVGIALQLGGDLLQRRRHGLARAAPLGEEIDHHGLGGAQHDLLEVGVRNEGGGVAHDIGLLEGLRACCPRNQGSQT